jgi:hypothetical protein
VEHLRIVNGMAVSQPKYSEDRPERIGYPNLHVLAHPLSGAPGIQRLPGFTRTGSIDFFFRLQQVLAPGHELRISYKLVRRRKRLTGGGRRPCAAPDTSASHSLTMYSCEHLVLLRPGRFGLLVGEGGMGAVYKAYDSELSKPAIRSTSPPATRNASIAGGPPAPARWR